MTSKLSRFAVDDLYRITTLEDVQISPDGSAVAWVTVAVDRLNNRYRRTIWLAHAGAAPRRFTTAGSDSSPRWSPDSRMIAFVSQRSGELPQIYRIALGGGEAEQLTAMPNGATDPAWSPDGRQIAFRSRVSEQERLSEELAETPPPPTSAWEVQRRSEELRHQASLRTDPLVVTKLPYRSGTNFFDDKRNHLYLIDLPASDAEMAKPRRISDGDLHYAAPTWMPDGSALLTTATRDPEADSLFAFYDVLRIPASGGPAETLTDAGHSYFDPQPSPDGSLIAFRRVPEDRLLAAGSRVAIIPATGGDPYDLTAHTDLDVEQFHWQPDGQAIMFSAGWHGDAQIYRVAGIHASGARQSELLTTERQIVSSFSVAQNGTIAYIAGQPDQLSGLFLQSAAGAITQIWNPNASLLAEREISPIETLRYRAPDGEEVQGWVLYPPDFSANQRHPLAVYIHGGPHVMWGPGFSSMWHEWQTAAAQGYVVFFCNPRGSEGYGEQWRDAIHGNWGHADMHDIVAGVDHLIERGGIDPQRVGVTGGSYGGYMTAWLIAHTDRFSAAVAARGVFNLLTEHSTSDAHELIEIEFSGYPWELQEELWDHSPLAHAHKINTPLLILHGELDFRVPISEAEQLFAILRRQKKVVEMVRYPREGHELTRSGEPRHRADHMRRTLAWFDQFLQAPTKLG